MTPDEFTISETLLDVGDGHLLYVHDWGNKTAKVPIVFLHGGPGGSVKDRYKQSLDPVRQRVIFFDQRGCGRSTPYGSLDQTTSDLIEDINKITKHLAIEKFVLTGGSWGSCLALAYALEHPQRVIGMVLNGIFTGSQSEIEWLDHGRFATFFPDAWDRYLAATPEAERQLPSEYHFKRALNNDLAAAAESAQAYENLEGAVIQLDDRFTPGNAEDYDPTSIRVEMYYMKNGCFMADRHILDNAHKLTMPIWLLQGRYDMVCPPRTAYELDKLLPHGSLIWTLNGHKPEHETLNLARTILLQLTDR